MSPKSIIKYQTPKFNEIKENMNIKQIEKVINDNRFILLRNKINNQINNKEEFDFKKIDYKIQK
jgi:hypothetical protein